jgi:hypothetical protein
MENNENNLRSDTVKALELREIKHKYKNLIEGDLILKADIDRLISDFDALSPASLQKCKKILNHLEADIDESVEDDQRMDDESPVLQAQAIVDNNQNDYLLFKKMLKDFYKNYISSKYDKE